MLEILSFYLRMNSDTLLEYMFAKNIIYILCDYLDKYCIYSVTLSAIAVE